MPSILLLVNALLRHGPGLLVGSLAERLAASGHRVLVVSLDSPDPSLGEALKAKGVCLPDLTGAPDQPQAIARIVRTHGVEVVHTHGLRADLAGRRLGLLRQRPVIVSTVHDAPRLYVQALGRLKGSLALAGQLLSWPLADAVVMVAGTVAGAYRRFLPLGLMAGRIHVIHNGVPDCYLSAADSPDRNDRVLRVGSVGRLVPWKGHEFLIDAAAEVARDFPGIQYTLIGDGELRPQLIGQVQRLGLGDSFHFLGEQADIPAALRDLDVFVLPSLNECLPLALLEALSAGKPIIATGVGGIPEVIIRGENGLLVQPGDSRALAASLCLLAGDEALRMRLGQAARQRYLENFTVQGMVGKYAALYRSLLVSRSGRGSPAVPAVPDDGR